MELLTRIQQYFESMELKRFYQYSAALLICVILLILGITYYFYWSISSIHDELQEVNTKREEVRAILQRAERVKVKRDAVNALIKQNEGFRLTWEFAKLLEPLHLTPASIGDTQINAGATYNEDVLTAQLTGITMQDLTKLLEVIEQNKRIYTKELGITRSKTTPDAIDVTLTIATLQPIAQGSTAQTEG